MPSDRFTYMYMHFDIEYDVGHQLEQFIYLFVKFCCFGPFSIASAAFGTISFFSSTVPFSHPVLGIYCVIYDELEAEMKGRDGG